jgi:hypothetical protein
MMSFFISRALCATDRCCATAKPPKQPGSGQGNPELRNAGATNEQAFCGFSLAEKNSYGYARADIKEESFRTMNAEPNHSKPAAKKLSPEIRDILMSIGRGLGTVGVYGPDHPSVELIVSQAHGALNETLKSGQIAIGSFNGSLTVDEEPVEVHDIPIKTLEKRLVSMKVSHLVLHAGLSKEELKQLFSALCASSGEAMKESLAKSGLRHVEIEDVKYVTLREGEKKTGRDGGLDDIPPAQVSQIVAFLKGQPSSENAAESIKKAISDPEKLGQMILEAAAVRQSGVDVQNGESLADIVIGCLRRTYDGLRKEPEFRNVQGKANLTKAMMLLEKTVLDKIHRSLGEKHPEIDRRIIKAIREMEEDRHFEVMAAHYSVQSEKLNTVENKIIDAIKAYGKEKAMEQLKNAGIPQKDWQRLMIQAGEQPLDSGGTGLNGGGLPGVDMSALAVVLEKLEGLMQIETQDPDQMRNLVKVTQNGLTNYTDRIENRIQELEGQVELIRSQSPTLEDHAGHLTREDLMLEISNLTLALVQPLTVVNASLEAAKKHAKGALLQELLDLAYLSGQRMQSLSKRMMLLVGYPVLDSMKKPA